MSKKNNRIIWLVLTIAAAAVFVVCAGLIARQFYENQRQQEMDSHITLLARPSQTVTLTPAPTATPAPTVPKPRMPTPICFI